jgi:hypothetical protein
MIYLLEHIRIAGPSSSSQEWPTLEVNGSVTMKAVTASDM